MLAAAFLVLGPHAAAADVPRAVVFTLQQVGAADSGQGYASALTDVVVSAFASSGVYTVLPPASWQAEARARSLDDRDVLDSAAATAVGQGVGADLAVEGAYAIVPGAGSDQIIVSLRCWDVRTRRLAGGLERTARFDLGFYLSLRDWITELVPSLGVSVAPPASVILPSGVTTTSVAAIVFVCPQDGVEVSVGDDRVIGVVVDGRLSFPQAVIPSGSVLRVTKRKAGYFTAVQVVKVSPEVTLSPLVPLRTNAAELAVTAGDLLGLTAAVRAYAASGNVFIGVGTAASVQPPINAPARAVIHLAPWVLAGSYLFFPPDFPVRLSAALGAGVMFTAFTEPGFQLSSDFYLALPSVTLETSILGPQVYLRLESRYLLGFGTNLLGRGWASGGAPLLSLGVILP
jgi:hypothetical protein